MSGPSNIAAIRHAVSALHGAADDGADTRRHAEALQEIGATIDELIAAGDRVTAAFSKLGETRSAAQVLILRNECEASMVALDAALARAKGGAG